VVLTKYGTVLLAMLAATQLTSLPGLPVGQQELIQLHTLLLGLPVLMFLLGINLKLCLEILQLAGTQVGILQ
tara:strand:- start:960 stop:1175 length:216 start_codon:yes stop_codon:yes gene_type:complete